MESKYKIGDLMDLDFTMQPILGIYNISFPIPKFYYLFKSVNTEQNSFLLDQYIKGSYCSENGFTIDHDKLEIGEFYAWVYEDHLNLWVSALDVELNKIKKEIGLSL